MRKRILSGALSLIMALALVLGAAALPGYAADCTVTFSDPTVTVGNNVTINVNVSGSVAAATIRMAYDQSMLEYVSGNLGYGSGGGGVVLMDNENMSSGGMSFSMTFRALKTGSTTISCVGYDIVDGNGDAMTVNMGSSVVTITAPPTASSDANLRSLSISPGSISPAFSASNTKYSASVSNATTSVAVSAATSDSKAKLSYWGNTGLKVGANTVTVQVTAEDGTKKVYTITVTRAAGSNTGNQGGSQDPTTSADPSPSPSESVKPEVPVTLPNGIQLPISDTLPEGELPAGFTQSQVEYGGQTFPAIALGDRLAVYLAGDEANPAGYYFLDTETGKVTMVQSLAMSAGTLVPLNVDPGGEVPQDYTVATVTLGQGQYSVYVPAWQEEADHYIVYALNGEETGLYLYDVAGESFQRYNFIALQEEEPQEEPVEEESGFVFSLFLFRFPTGLTDQGVSRILAGLALGVLVLVIVVIVLIVCLVKARRNLWLYTHDQDWEEDEEELQPSVPEEKPVFPLEEGEKELPVETSEEPEPKEETGSELPGMSLEEILREYRDVPRPPKDEEK